MTQRPARPFAASSTGDARGNAAQVQVADAAAQVQVTPIARGIGEAVCFDLAHPARPRALKVDEDEGDQGRIWPDDAFECGIAAVAALAISTAGKDIQPRTLTEPDPLDQGRCRSRALIVDGPGVGWGELVKALGADLRFSVAGGAI
jgi:hypothetical protein